MKKIFKKNRKVTKSKKMVLKKEWTQFRKAGLLWWVNRMLHLFGWVMVVEVDDHNKITNAYPAKTKFRGFAPDCEERGFKAVTNYLSKNVTKLKKDCSL